MARICVYLRFDGNCSQAMEFYKHCLDADLDLQKIKDTPMAAQMPPEAGDKVLHAAITKGDLTLFASDMIGDEGLTTGNSLSVCMVGLKAEIAPAFDKLAAGGKVLHPLEDTFFGSYGDLIDKYGVSWMFQAEKPRE